MRFSARARLTRCAYRPSKQRVGRLATCNSVCPICLTIILLFFADSQLAEKLIKSMQFKFSRIGQLAAGQCVERDLSLFRGNQIRAILTHANYFRVELFAGTSLNHNSQFLTFPKSASFIAPDSPALYLTRFKMPRQRPLSRFPFPNAFLVKLHLNRCIVDPD